MKKNMYMLVIGLVSVLILTCCGKEISEEQYLNNIEKKETPNNYEEEMNINIDKEHTLIVRELSYSFKYDNSNWFRVSYTIGNKEKIETGYMNERGEILSTSPIKGYSNTANAFILYDKDDNVIYDSEKDGSSFSRIIYKNNDNYLIERETTNINEKARYVGLIDNKGEWIFEPFLISRDYPGLYLNGSTVYELGEDLIGCYQENILFVFNVNTGEYFVLNNVIDDFIHYYNGKMIVKNDKGISLIDKKGQEKKFIDTDSKLAGVSDNGFITLNEKYISGMTNFYRSLSYYDTDGSLQWTFDKYDIKYSILYNDYIFVQLLGVDQNLYVGCIDRKTGNLIYEPFKDEITYISQKSINKYIGENYILVSDEHGYVCMKDLSTGEESISLDIDKSYLQDIEGYIGGLFMFNKRNSENYGIEYSFYNISGEKIMPHIM